jgi:hypothetical protein
MDGMDDYGYGGRPHRSGGGRRSRGRLQLAAGVIGTTFAVVLAIVVGQRLDQQAIAVLAGTVCGVAASIPTSLLIIWVTRRRQEQQHHQSRQPTGQYPPVVVVQPPPQMGSSLPGQQGYLTPYGQQTAPRQFTVVGGETDDINSGEYP